ncbi:MAG TPA: hypothetical protein VM871_07845 [Flavisolibacter sp.]|nr:hypothetical protein [Flavisolibacter sp.]
MKQLKAFAAALTFLGLLSCGNNDSESKPATTKTGTSEESKQSPASQATGGNDITGEWEMQGSVVDTNDNLQIDEEERKVLKPASFKDYMKLNSDGTGLFTVGKMEGHYEVSDGGGKKFLRWFDKANGQHRIGTIIKIAPDELHIKEPGGSGLFVWKRI